MKGRKIFPGKARGEALVTKDAVSFFGGVDPDTGKIAEQGHELYGQSISGKIFVFPQGKGSTVGSYTMYQLKKNGLAPLAIINRETETVVAVGAIISEIPCVDRIDISNIKTGDIIEVDAENGTVTKCE